VWDAVSGAVGDAEEKGGERGEEVRCWDGEVEDEDLGWIRKVGHVLVRLRAVRVEPGAGEKQGKVLRRRGEAYVV